MDENQPINPNENEFEQISHNFDNKHLWSQNNHRFIDKTTNITPDQTNDKIPIDNQFDNIPNNSCKQCNECVCDDMSSQFFASGPFYAIENLDNNNLTDDNSHKSIDRRERSSKCNVLYAEMPQLPQMTMDSNNLGQNEEHMNEIKEGNSVCCGINERHPTSSGRLVVDNNYQFLYYNYCGSPLSICEDSQLTDNLYYLSSDESKLGIYDKMDHNERSTLSSPIMLKFYREKIDEINHKLNKDDSKMCCSSNQRLSDYTTVIKPKAVRPQFNTNCDSSNSPRNGIMSSTLSFHGSTNVLTDSDESAFRQIPRRRSNSEATHYYQSINNDSSHHMTHRNTIDNSRPLFMAERCRSVNKAFNFDNSVDFRRSNAFSDKQTLQNNSDNPNCLNRNISENNNYMETRAQQTSAQQQSEPIHMTLEEVRNIFSKNHSKRCKSSFFMPKSFVEKYKKATNELNDTNVLCKSKSKSKIKCALENLFRTKRKSNSPVPSQDQNIVQSEPPIRNCTSNSNESHNNSHNLCANDISTSPFTHRALPPLPNNSQDLQTDLLNKQDEDYERQKFLDYAASIERVKDCGWYWGPISGEMAEKLLATEPCGSFIVRDSSDEHYIFSLTFKLNGLVRHVRIEHDQGNFSFGSLQKFRSNTIVDFIENAVEHSRSGRFLFFLHRRPVMGPMRVQLLHPVSRFKQIQSLQHMCRFVILKHVRRDLIDELPLPKMLKSYLNTPYYYAEELANINKNEEPNESLPLNTSQ